MPRTPLALLALPALCALPLTGLAADSTIVPGRAASGVRLGGSRSQIRKTHGEPDRTFATHQHCSVDAWNSRDLAEVVYRRDRLVQIKVRSEGLKTASGLSTASPRKRILGVYPHLKVTHYLYDTETGKGLDYYDDVAGGITFVFANTASENPDADRPGAIIIHPPGQAAIPTDIKDPRNTGVVEPAGETRARPRQTLASSCAGFVQQHYNWYRTLLEQDTREPAVMIAIRRKPQLFSSDLRNLIAADRAAEQKNRSGYIVGLDFDPVTGGSDYAEQYRTQRVTRRGQSYLVEVRAINRSDSQKSLPVSAEVVRWKGRWVFVNFHYPKRDGAGSRDLRSILKELRRDRKAGRV